MPVLLAVFAILVAWAWIFERRGPAFPSGDFFEVVAFPVLLLLVAYIFSLFGDFRKGP
jgi:hypothetical protein